MPQGVFDLKKAFDSVDHDVLLKKLEIYGIRGTTNEWIRSYLNSRKQYISIDSSVSNVLNVSCGVPQGSVLGPQLLIMYINDICNGSDILKFILFADDTNVFCADSDVARLVKASNTELDKLNV